MMWGNPHPHVAPWGSQEVWGALCFADSSLLSVVTLCPAGLVGFKFYFLILRECSWPCLYTEVVGTLFALGAGEVCAALPGCCCGILGLSCSLCAVSLWQHLFLLITGACPEGLDHAWSCWAVGAAPRVAPQAPALHSTAPPLS